MTDNKPALIWALFFGGVIIVFTPFIGIVFAYMWKGAAETLKARPAMMNTTPTNRPTDGAPAAAIEAAIASKPVAPVKP